MLINDIATFTAYIPTAGRYNPDPTESDFDTIKPFLEEAEDRIKNELLGVDLFEKIESIADSTPEDPTKDALRRIVAINAYFICIPFVDLISTPNGFAVVSSTNNIAPASKERVERLLDWLKLRLSESTDTLIYLFLMGSSNSFRDEWKKSVHFERCTNCLFITSGDLQNFGRSKGSRLDLNDVYPLLISYQEDMANTVSYEYLNELIEHRRNDVLTQYDKPILYRLQVALGLYLKEKPIVAKELLGTIVNIMIADEEHYITYINSQAYRIKISENYVNKQDDPTFMFNP